MKSTRHSETHCPACGCRIDTATSAAGYVPKPGDLTICAECYAVSQYGAELALMPIDTATLDAETLRDLDRHITALAEAKRHA